MKFCAERETSVGVSFSTFCRAKPSSVKLTHYLRREVCLCKPHANMALRCEAIPNMPKSTSHLVAMTNDDIRDILDAFPWGSVNFKSWEKVKKVYNGKEVSHTKLVEKSLQKSVFIDEFMAMMAPFRAHCDRVETQYQGLRSRG